MFLLKYFHLVHNGHLNRYFTRDIATIFVTLSEIVTKFNLILVQTDQTDLWNH